MRIVSNESIVVKPEQIRLVRRDDSKKWQVHYKLDGDLGANIVIAILVGRNLQAHAFKAHAVVVIDLAIMLLAQDVG